MINLRPRSLDNYHHANCNRKTHQNVPLRGFFRLLFGILGDFRVDSSRYRLKELTLITREQLLRFVGNTAPANFFFFN